MANRLGILVLYDQQNVISQADCFIAREMASVASKLVICINADDNVRYVDNLPKEDHIEIFFRRNKGFDGGAIKDVLFKYLGRKNVEVFDELFICNNSFFGPFVSMREIFDKVDQLECDYWGLSGNTQEYTSIFSGADSYFWGFRKNILLSDDFWDYFNQYISSDTLKFFETCAFYENGLNEFLMEKYELGIVYNIDNINIFDAADVAVIQYDLPILKRKFFIETTVDENRKKNVLRYINQKKIYNVNLIEEKLNRLYHMNIYSDGLPFYLHTSDIKNYISPKINISYQEIERFINENKEIYIYGIGHIALLVWGVFSRKSDRIRGFVVSKRDKEGTFEGLPIYEIEELKEPKSIIVAMNKSNSMQVKKLLVSHNTLFIS